MKQSLKVQPLVGWMKIGNSFPLIISGPCSAESENQMMETAISLAALGSVHVLRAGIWKPRTHPGQYEGRGAKALKWLVSAKIATGLPIATEVATASHVEQCLAAGVDILWLGARTTANPFSVQEVADSLRGVDIPILIKNPINPDIELWIGALERLNRVGVKKLVAVHRGFSSFDRGPFRNVPLWDIPMELKMRCPDLDIICDPSHITGHSDMIPFVAQKAIDLNMSGLMIESHIRPAEALSDAEQQISPAVLDTVLTNLIIRRPSSVSKEFSDLLELFREKIDRIDNEIMNSISARIKIVEQIGHHKYLNEVTVFQVDRWEKIIKTRLVKAKELGLADNFVKKLLSLLHNESIQTQQRVMNKEKKHKFC